MATKTHLLTITGMTCGCCSGRVNRALKANPEVLDAMITFDSEKGAVLTTDALSTEDVMAIIAATGFEVSA
ncbi:MAG TPA: heavy-metal-associated domain-containing protein [Candidatus Poseidoniales archaeon]|nr:MAG TPA: heavy-metal-associated domain-containing protein [Candidatus Poseidoniales archaeon]HII26928.1 heavy-metal-associated domain-containing protein [Poseidonia sp.]|tara:strand:+ start:450 stop:662 length:213 start_codon:yes stop_codon:yes gene_type:complete